MKKSWLSTVSIASILLLVSGCANYRASPMSPMLTHLSQDSNKGLTIIAKKFDQQDCRKFLDRDVIRKGYQPIQLYIHNNTNTNYVFSLNNVGLVHADPMEVARQVHTSTVGRAVGYGVCGLLVWPFLIPAVVDGIKSSEANDALDRDFLEKAASDQIISAHSYFNKLIFIPSNDCPRTFSLSLANVSSNEVDSFVVTLDDQKLNLLSAAQR